MNLDKVKAWVKAHKKQAGLGAAGLAVVGLAVYRKRAAAQGAQGLAVGFQPQETATAGQDAAAGAYDQFTTVLGQLSQQQQDTAGTIYDAIGQIAQGVQQGQSSIFDAMSQNAAQQNTATGGMFDSILAAIGQPASPTAPRAAASGPNQGVYTFNPGDTIDSVASKYGVSVGQLLAANPTSGSNFTDAGHRVTVPVASAAASGPKPSIVYTPGKNESVASIASKFGITVAQLNAANSKSGQALNKAGHRITIPGT